ncbi:glutamate--cysteine ligase [Aquihabitans sp. G128]|uniref:glutamate--cysteine ligase n=1 Tax=Aquihabitans sp. G128 TaxID=2849779 RepID=UPI001C250402|nr:glutamate--cysteine ligase [Aquihabitans sp. G128]QXC61840.1 glutamate--cysteine ligase [Aquihabitans sp. G128]
MQIDFNSSPGPSLGIEVELELVDAETGALASAATDLLAELGEGHPQGEHPKAKHELFECTVEIITGICGTVADARADLEATLAEVRGAAEARGLALLCSGTHPFSAWSDQQVSPNPRYARLVEEMQWMARRLQIFGVHVHVGIRSPEKAISIANALAGYIPHFLALSASSPYWEGRDTGLASSRSKVFEGLPTAGLPAPIENWADFEQYMETLVSSAAISTVREVWWDIRPHPEFGTVELRMCDGIPTMSEICAVAALAQSLVAHLDGLDDRGFTLPRHKEWILRQNKWRAGRHGLDTDLIVDQQGRLEPARDAITALVEEVTPAAGRLGCTDELAHVGRMLEVGPSYERQRKVAGPDAAGPDALKPVVDALVRELATDTMGA